MPPASDFTAAALPAPRLWHHLLFWFLACALLIGFIALFGPVLLPFVLGLAIAYLLNPVVSFLARRKIPRWIAALAILGLFILFVAGAIALAVPHLYREAVDLANAMPGYIDHLWQMTGPYVGWAQDRFANGETEGVKEALRNNIGNALKAGAGVLAGLAGGGKALAGFMSTLVLTPLIAFFMMEEWPRMTGWVDSLLPRGSRETIRGLLKQIDGKIAGFVRGQISIAFALGVIYALALTFAGLKFGFLIGMAAGFLSVIPLVGSTAGLLAAGVVAWFQSGEIGYTGMIAGIFIAGQFIEGHILTPRLLGESVGLHPLWILFALMAGGSMLGIVGMLLAVPAFASAGVLIGFALGKYRESPYYLKA